jgi:hypothetical protein
MAFLMKRDFHPGFPPLGGTLTPVRLLEATEEGVAGHLIILDRS